MGRNMKECNRKSNTYEKVLEQIEQAVEEIEPGSTVKLADIIDQFGNVNRNGDITKAAIMLLKKYGICFE